MCRNSSSQRQKAAAPTRGLPLTWNLKIKTNERRLIMDWNMIVIVFVLVQYAAFWFFMGRYYQIRAEIRRNEKLVQSIKQEQKGDMK